MGIGTTKSFADIKEGTQVEVRSSSATLPTTRKGASALLSSWRWKCCGLPHTPETLS